ncbi:TraU family protein, partial [bacterium]|nr:TraU family protein [bacterium]
GSIEEAVRQRSIGGELSHRYGIDELPALIELDDDGNYRLVSKPSSLMEGVVNLNGKAFAREPSNILSRNSRIRNGRNQDTNDNAEGLPTAEARAADDIVNLVLNGELVTVPFDAMFPDQFVVDNGAAPNPEDFIDVAFVVDDEAVEQIVADNPAFIYTGVDDLANYVLEQLSDGNYIGLDEDGNLPVPPPELDPETGEECLPEEEAIIAAEAFGNMASFNPCTGEVLSVYVYEHGEEPGEGGIVECLVESELNEAIAEAGAANPEAATFDNCTGEILTSLVLDDDGNEIEVDYNTGLPLCLSEDELNDALALVTDYGQYDPCTGEVLTVFEYDESGVATEIDVSTGLPYEPYDPDACLIAGETNPFSDEIDVVLTEDPCTGAAITVVENVDGELVELPVGANTPILDCLLEGETPPYVAGEGGVVSVDACTGQPTVVIIDIEGVPTEVAVEDLIDPDDPDSVNQSINETIEEIVADNPDLPPSDSEVVTEGVVDEILVDIFTDSEYAESTVGSVDGGAITTYGEGVRYSILDSILSGNLPESFNCLDIRITGTCVYAVVRVYCSIFGCSVEPSLEGSLQVTNGNPELLIAAYPRLGASPITESRELFGRLSLEVSKLAIESITGYDVPVDYMDENLWGATDTDTDGAPGINKFHEVDVIGHPGTFYSLMSADQLLPIDAYIARLKAGPQNIYNGLIDSFPLIGPLFTASIDLIFNGGADSGPDWPVEPRQRLLTADGSLDKGLVTWGRDGMVDEHGRPRELFASIDAVGENFPTVEQMASSVDLPTLLLIRQIVDAMFFDGALAANDRLIAILVEIYNVYNDYVAAVELIQNISYLIDVASNPAILIDELAGELSQYTEMLETMTEGLDLVSDIAAFGGDTELWSMCPSGSEFLKPYMLSGLDAIQWKFNVPEILFPQTYIPPFPFFKDYYVGDLSISDDDGFFFPNAWGPIYPRVGYVMQTDRMKAAAVTAARAAHIVTRSNQLHVASQIPAYRERFLDIESPQAYNPRVRESGKWQLVAPQVEDQCIVLSDDDNVLSPWTSDKQGPLDEMLNYPSYVFAYWRDTTCCPEPRPAGSVIYAFVRVATLDFPNLTVLD